MEHFNVPACDVQNKIVIEEKVPLAYAAILAENALFRFDPRVQEGVAQWVNGTLLDTFAVEDISLKEIQEQVGGSLFQALCVLDIVLKNGDFLHMVDWYEGSDSIYAD